MSRCSRIHDYSAHDAAVRSRDCNRHMNESCCDLANIAGLRLCKIACATATTRTGQREASKWQFDPLTLRLSERCEHTSSIERAEALQGENWPSGMIYNCYDRQRHAKYDKFMLDDQHVNFVGRPSSLSPS